MCWFYGLIFGLKLQLPLQEPLWFQFHSEAAAQSSLESFSSRLRYRYLWEFVLFTTDPLSSENLRRQTSTHILAYPSLSSAASWTYGRWILATEAKFELIRVSSSKMPFRSTPSSRRTPCKGLTALGDPLYWYRFGVQKTLVSKFWWKWYGNVDRISKVRSFTHGSHFSKVFKNDCLRTALFLSYDRGCCCLVLCWLWCSLFVLN